MSIPDPFDQTPDPVSIPSENDTLTRAVRITKRLNQALSDLGVPGHVFVTELGPNFPSIGTVPNYHLLDRAAAVLEELAQEKRDRAAGGHATHGIDPRQGRLF